MRPQLDAQGIETLVFVLDSGLRSIPLAALHDGQGFLIERFNLGLVPSMSLTDTRYRNIQQARILAMGASVQDLSPLPAVPLELAQITQDLGGGRQFLNADFTIANWQRQHNQGGMRSSTLPPMPSFSPAPPKRLHCLY